MRQAISNIALVALLIAGTAIAAPPQGAQPASAASVAAPADKLSPGDRKRLEAIQQYQHDLVNVVALRADPDYLLGAAILARPFKHQMQGLDFDSLSERAANAVGAGPVTQWVRLDACKTDADCPNAAAYADLKKQAAGNAAVWLLDMDFAAVRKDKAAELAALKKAAAAQTYDDYYGKALADVVKAASVLPPLADTTRGAHDGQPDSADGVRVFVAFMNTQAYIRPGFGPVDKLCRRATVAKTSGLKSECLKLAHTLQWGSSPVARAVGLHMQAELDLDNAAQYEQASRNLSWQVQQYSRQVRRMLVDPAPAAKWLAMAGSGGTELSLVLATLRANNIPTDAPADASPAAAGSSGQ